MSRIAEAALKQLAHPSGSSPEYESGADAGAVLSLSAQANGQPEFDAKEVAELAYLRWEGGGRAADTADDDWYWAEREFLKRREVMAASVAKGTGSDGKWPENTKGGFTYHVQN